MTSGNWAGELFYCIDDVVMLLLQFALERIPKSRHRDPPTAAGFEVWSI